MKSKSKEKTSSPEPDPVSLIDSLNCDSRNDRYIDLEASRKAATRALNLAKEHLYPRGEAYACMNLATGHFLRSENKEALEYCSKILEYFKDHSSEPGYADALTCIGNIYESFGEYETALEYCQNAYKICEEIKYREGLGEVQSVLGLIYTRLSDFELALEAYKQSLQIREELGDQRAVASSLNRIARTYTLKKQYEQALSYYNKSLRIRESLDQKEAIEWTYLGFASTYEEMGAMDDAQIYYQKILETAESRSDDRLKLQALLGMGRTFSKLKMETEALQCFEDSLALAIKLQAKPLQGEAYKAMAEYFETLGFFERALVHYKDYLKIQEEVLNDETRNRLKNQQIAFAVEKSEREREIFQLRNVELKAAYDEIQQANEEVLAANEALQEQKKELQLALENLKITQSQLIDSEKMASVAVLTAGMAHELNNPINFVSGNVNPLRRDIKDLFSLLKKYDDIVLNKDLSKEFGEVADLKDEMDYRFLAEEITNLLAGIEEGANRSSQIVKGLRSFSRLDEEKFEIYDIHEGIESSLIILQNKIKNRITIHRDFGEFEDIECYPGKLNQVVLNVLTNSIQSIEGKGDIHIQTLSNDNGVKIMIKDNGKGMTPEVKKHIFEPFFTTKEVGEGMGLGLSISFGIIEQHKGKIDVNSGPGKGTEVIISLPKTQSE